MQFKKYVSLFVALVWLNISNAIAQPFSVDQMPLSVRAKVDASITGAQRNVNLSTNISVTINNIDALLRSVLPQVKFPKCHSRWNTDIEYAVTDVSISSFGLTGRPVYISAQASGNTCVARFLGSYGTISIPLSLVVRDSYLVVRAGRPEITGGALVQLSSNVLSRLVDRMVAKINDTIRNTQASVMRDRGVRLFHPKIDGDPQLYKSLAGALVLEARLVGNLSNTTVNTWLNGR